MELCIPRKNKMKNLHLLKNESVGAVGAKWPDDAT